MKKALVWKDRREARIHQVVPPGQEFPVSPEMEWVDVPNTIEAGDEVTPTGARKRDRSRDVVVEEEPPTSPRRRLLKLIQVLEGKGVLTPGEV